MVWKRKADIQGIQGNKGDKGDPAVGDGPVSQLVGSSKSATKKKLNATFLRVSADNVGVIAPPGSKLVAYGHEWIAEGVGTVAATTDYYARQVAAALSLDYAGGRRGVIGDRAEGTAVRVVNTTPYTPGAASTVLVQALRNSAGKYGDNAVAKTAALQSLRSTVAFLSASARVEQTDAMFTYFSPGAAWTAGTSGNPSGGSNTFSAVNGAYVSFTAPAVRTYVVITGKQTTTGGPIVTVTANDAVIDTFNLSSQATPSPDTPTTVYYAWEIPASARGKTIKLTQTSGSSSLTFDVLLPQSDTPPTVVLVKEPYLANYAANTAFPKGSDTATDSFNALIDLVAGEFPNVLVADPNANGWDRTTCLSSDGINPNTAGWNVMAASVLAAIRSSGGVAGLTRVQADSLYQLRGDAISVRDGSLSWTDSRVGGVLEDPTTVVTPQDQTTTWNRAMDLLSRSGGELFIGQGIIGLGGTTAPVPGGARVRGTGFDYSDPSQVAPARGSVIRALGVMDRLVQLGPDGAGSSVAAANTGGSIASLSVDGRNLAKTVIKTAARRNYIDNCQVYSGSERALWFAGQNSYLIGKSVVYQDNIGDVVLIDSYYDHKLFDAEIRGPGPTGAAVRLQGLLDDITISRCHMWAGGNGIGRPAQGLIVFDTVTAGGSISDVNISDNIIEGVYGPEIVMLATGGPAAGIYAVKISGNNMFNAGIEDAKYPVIAASGPGSIADVVIEGNTARASNATSRYKSWIDYGTAPGFSGRWLFANNAGRFFANVLSGVTPPQPPVMTAASSILLGSTARYTRNQGRKALDGTGTQTAFTIAHGLDSAPGWVDVTAGSSAAASTFYVTSDATNIAVTFSAPPAAGTGNVVLNWQASM